MSTFAELLGQFIHRSTYSLSQLEAFSGVPKRTVANWQGGITLKPQKWQDIVKVALALDLSDTETSSLLETARHLTLDELIANTADEDIGLLQRWVKDTTSPFQAIADLPSFVGREDEIAQITQALQQKSNIAICSFHGMGGVGKTTLAAHLAYRLRQHFSDGVLWAQLGNGNTLSILAAFARAFGEDVSGFQDIDSRSAIVRDILASKRVLIILDNATNSQEVRYLLPPTTGKPMTIVTTREDLAVTDTMERIELSPFANNGRDSLALFTFYLDGRYVKQHKQILRDIADAVGHLPLALSIIAGQLGRQPAMIEVLASTLREKTAYLDMLQREDQSVRLSFDLSYENLTPSLRRLFNALGLFHGGDFSAEAVAFILDLSTPHAEEQIEELIRLSLVQLGQAGRFRLHPLLNAYAREKVVPRALRLKAMTYFTNLAETAVSNDYSKLVPEIENIKGLLNMAHQRNDVSPFLKGVNAFSPLFLAQGLLEIQEKYLGMARSTALKSDNIGDLADILLRQGFLYVEKGMSAEANRLLEEAYSLTEAIRFPTEIDLRRKADLLRGLGVLAVQIQNDHELGDKYYKKGLEIASKINYGKAEARITLNLGVIAFRSGKLEQAIKLHHECLEQSKRIGDHDLSILCLSNLCHFLRMKGDLSTALKHLTEAEQMARTHGYHMHLIMLLGSRGMLAAASGDQETQEIWAGEAIKIARETGHQRSLAEMLGARGNRARLRGELAIASTCIDEALALIRRLHIPDRLCLILLYDGILKADLGRWTDAETVLQELLQLANSMSFSHFSVSARIGLERCALSRGEHDLAIAHRNEWQRGFVSLNTIRKQEIMDWLPETDWPE